MPSPTSSQEALECLAAALDPNEFVTSLSSGYGCRPYLTVTSRHAALGDNVYADATAYTWSWAEHIASTSHPHAAAEISRFLGTGPG
jgi:hypothetical protein